jgi:aminoglycoside 6'-N-acetyltransferase-1b
MAHTSRDAVLTAVPEVTLRLMTEADLAMLHEWLHRPHIVAWWGGEDARPSLEDVRQQYLPSVLAEEGVTPYIAMVGTQPIGYAQSYVAMGSGDGWCEEETDPGVRGIDQSLANAADLNKGLGTALVRALVNRLFSDPSVTKIQTDPSPDNHRAIRCYEKASLSGSHAWLESELEAKRPPGSRRGGLQADRRGLTCPTESSLPRP